LAAADVTLLSSKTTPKNITEEDHPWKTSPEVRESPEVAGEEQATHELIKRILKLRWTGGL
jgi:hypothetical protein